jgi:hypothetical protein
MSAPCRPSVEAISARVDESIPPPICGVFPGNRAETPEIPVISVSFDHFRLHLAAFQFKLTAL